MNHAQTVRRLLAWSSGAVLLSAVSVTYMYAIPSPVSISTLEAEEVNKLAIASQPARLAFVSFDEEATISAFWKEGQNSDYSFTLLIDPAAEDAVVGSDQDVPSGEDVGTADQSQEPE